jgi:drug/metabolite transporter (DMT)-like permease
MTLSAVLILLVSAFAHAAWNWLGKRASSSATFYLAANALGCLCLSPVLFLDARAFPALLSSAWPLLLVSGFFQALYYVSLSNAYRAGELSIAYPIVRSASVLFVLLASFVLGRGRQLSPLAVTGIVVVAAGILVLPHRRFRDFTPREFLTPAALFALCAAVGTMGYSLADDQALRILRPLLSPASTNTETALLYYLAAGMATCGWLGLFILASRCLRINRLAGAAHERVPLGSAFLTGFGIYFAYALVLVAMGLARNVSYVVAFRQMSVPLGVAFGVIALKEPLPAPKVAGVLAIAAGLVLVGVG